MPLPGLVSSVSAKDDYLGISLFPSIFIVLRKTINENKVNFTVSLHIDTKVSRNIECMIAV